MSSLPFRARRTRRFHEPRACLEDSCEPRLRSRGLSSCSNVAARTRRRPVNDPFVVLPWPRCTRSHCRCSANAAGRPNKRPHVVSQTVENAFRVSSHAFPTDYPCRTPRVPGGCAALRRQLIRSCHTTQLGPAADKPVRQRSAPCAEVSLAADEHTAPRSPSAPELQRLHRPR